jgi:Tfp pilus assembly protein PilF
VTVNHPVGGSSPSRGAKNVQARWRNPAGFFFSTICPSQPVPLRKNAVSAIIPCSIPIRGYIHHHIHSATPFCGVHFRRKEAKMTDNKPKSLPMQAVIAEQEKICQEHPNNIIAHHTLGLLYRQAGRPDDAIRELERAIELDDHSVESYINLGAIYFDQGDVDRALELNEKALAITPQMAEAHVNIGLIRQQQGDAEAAVECYEKAIQIDPHLLTAWINLTSACTMLAQDDKAVESARQAVTLEPDSAMARNNLAVALYFAKEYEDSWQHMERAIELGYSVSPRFVQVLQEKLGK